ncbi:hypothetical protein D9619_000603 [Psilocybe cf. subviscida]|uniref:Velvet domain-containing protein n=1 Tax=Psilocybe cf. subviscida TaxID=2480587 RepID=A0A8H5F3X6_9AGAR|nr:hypothetical protein D9619_000603 [Psilocybe cf. subviscida]
MIQRTDNRQPSSSTPLRQEGPEIWGQWSGRKHYSLEVVQHPLRARMCGFGDKDRRPLAPAAVAKMIVRREDDSIVDVDEVDCSFFLVTVDLWSADGKHEMNLVLHPSSTDRYVPSHPSKSKRRPGGRTTPTPSQYRGGDQTGTSTPSLSAHAPYPSQSYFSPQTPSDNNNPYSQGTPYGAPSSDPVSSWGYPPSSVQVPSSIDRSAPFPPPILPSIHSFGRTAGSHHAHPHSQSHPHSTTTDTWQSEPAEPEVLPYRAWTTDTAYAPVDAHSASASSTHPEANREGYANNGDSDVYTHGPYSQHGQAQGQGQGAFSQYAAPQPQVPSSPAPTHTHAAAQQQQQQPLPRHTYTRTLVGPLSANACRLLDEHRKPGIFFLFQDLSSHSFDTFISAENASHERRSVSVLLSPLSVILSPPAPEIGAQRVHNDVSPVLAQTFTEQFTVFSAKRFPGVPDTTALSIAFGNQGQKLPLVRDCPLSLLPSLSSAFFPSNLFLPLSAEIDTDRVNGDDAVIPNQTTTPSETLSRDNSFADSSYSLGRFRIGVHTATVGAANGASHL